MRKPSTLKFRSLLIAGTMMAFALPAGAWAQANPFEKPATNNPFVPPSSPSAVPAKPVAVPVPPAPVKVPGATNPFSAPAKAPAVPPQPAPAPVKAPTPPPATPAPTATPAPQPPAPAQQAQQEDWCNRKNGASADQQIAGCTAMIDANKLAPKQRAIAFRLRGTGYFDKKQYDRALADYDQAISLDPSFALAYWNRGNVFNVKGHYDRAIREFDQAIKLNAGFSPAFFSRALAYQSKAQWDFDAYLNEGRYEELAIRDYEQIDPAQSERHRRLQQPRQHLSQPTAVCESRRGL